MFDAFKRALGGGEGAERAEEVRAELERVGEALEVRRGLLEDKRTRRLEALFPEGPVEGWSEARFPELDPVNFEEAEQQSWLVGVATRIIDGFPGGESLLSQLDTTLHAHADANYLHITEDGPYAQVRVWADEALRCWDLSVEVPLYVGNGSGSKVLGCKSPLVVFDRLTLDGLDEVEGRFFVSTLLGHLFFGNLRIFAFHRLMEVLDKMPSVGGLITRGLGMIPVVGNTISRGIELARSVNDQAIRKTNLVVGMQQHIVCDRLACLAVGAREPAFRFLSKQAVGKAEEGVAERLVEQGRRIHERFDRGEVDLHMMSVVGPTESFAAWRAYKLSRWFEDARSERIAGGRYVTRSRLRAYREAHEALEAEIKALEGKIVELLERQERLRLELQKLVTEA